MNKALQRRWYDRNPVLARCFECMERLSPTSQHLMAQILDTLANAMPLRQWGSAQTVALRKAKSRKRWYDRDPLLYKACNRLSLMDHQQIEQIAWVVYEPILILYEYEQLCIRQKISYKEKHLKELLKVTMAEGLESGKYHIELMIESYPVLSETA